MGTAASDATLPDQFAALARTPIATGGHDFAQLMAIVAGESAFKAHAHNRRTDAEGPFQFVRGTWLALLREHGVEFGIKPELIAEIKTDAKGRPTIADPAVLKTLLDLRHDLALSSRVAASYLDENAEALRRTLGRRPSEAEVQISFLLGAHGAARLIRAAAKTPSKLAVELVPRAAAANRHLFYTPSGEPRTVSETVAYLDRRFQIEKAKYAAYERAAPTGGSVNIDT